MNLVDILEQLAEGLALMGDRLPKIIADPRAYPRETMVFALILSVALVTITLLVFALAGLARARAERVRLGVRRRPQPALRRALVWSGSLVVACGIAGVLPMWSVTSGTCAACHATHAAIASWRAGAHARVGCYGCHAPEGVFGAWQAGAQGVASLLSDAPRQPASDAQCIRCHGAIAEGVLEARGIRVRHREVIDAGGACLACHPGVGHEASAVATLAAPVSQSVVVRPVMSRCLHCHDGATAAAECGSCHVGGKPSDSVSTRIQMGVTPAPVTCEGCHSAKTERSCVACHGLVLPHPTSFLGEHAGVSYSDPSLCAKCHETARAIRQDACACHADANLHGTYSRWFPIHGVAASANGRGGCRCHSAAFCGFCHRTDPFL